MTGNITINAGGILQSGTSGANLHTIQVGGNIVNNGTLNMTANAATNQTIQFNGSSSKTVSGSGTSTFGNITLNTTGVSSNVGINKNILVNGVVSWLVDGLLVVGTSSNITMGSGATFSWVTSSRYFQLDGL